ncbi:adenylate/guanylate cyclase domain-containing protein [Ancylothrix sp. C2]|uniref:CHASE2 domain-containing protein n=1 Tax=Ancylothrix sp. D3o TaxID=2953691 RepID=UPI0021BB3372|nr:adenylate/guanylate cyclase domain-containing protein [Ancylothrix sp. D3o]MCT7952491.1 adenylate/guanylate cyclase domain-containing protein [Ancylothrix sp. D3o]
MWAKLKKIVWEGRCVLIAAPTIAALTIGLRLTGLLQLLEWAAYDQFFRLRPPEPPDPRIVIVAINEPDILHAGQWPIPDAMLADLLIKINQQNPRAIGFDLFRPFPVQPGSKALIDVFKTTPNLIGVEKLVPDRYGAVIAPPAVLAQKNQVAAIDFILDGDGKLRRSLISLKPEGKKTKSSLGTKLALMYLNPDIKFEVLDAQKQVYQLGKIRLEPFEENDGGYVGSDSGGYQVLVNFRGAPGSFKTVSMTEVLKNEIPADTLRDKIVLIGSTAQSLRDFFITPFGKSVFAIPEPMTGVEVHANVTSQLISGALDGRSLIQVWDEPVEWLWVFGWSWVGAILGWGFRASRWTIYGLILAGGVLFAVTFFLFLGGWWVPVVPAFLTLAGSAIFITGYIAVMEREDRQMMMSLFGRHVSPKIAEAIWQQREQLLKQGQIFGQKMTATVLFTDIKGFTSIAENTDPETLMLWLNEYMNAMAELVLENEGVIDKYIGDAIMALFGVPVPRNTDAEVAEDALAAVSCALAMAERLRKLNQDWKKRGLPVICMRVGIATGTVVAGSLGSIHRQDYTAIGDSVNVAARLESYDKDIGKNSLCRILISEDTYQYIKEQFYAEFLARVSLKGRKQAIKIYQVPG